MLEVTDERRVLRELACRGRLWIRECNSQPIGYRSACVHDGTSPRGAGGVLGRGGSRCSAERRRQGDGRAQRWIRRITRVVHVREELRDNDAALRVREEIHLSPGLAPLELLHLLTQATGGRDQRALRVDRCVVAAVSRVRVVRDLRRLVAEFAGRQRRRRTTVRDAAVDAGDDHDAVVRAARPIGRRCVSIAVTSLCPPRCDAARDRRLQRESRRCKTSNAAPGRDQRVTTVGQDRAGCASAGCQGGSRDVHHGTRAVHQTRNEPAPLARSARRVRRISRGCEMHDGREVDRCEEQHRVDVRVARPETEMQDGSIVAGSDATGRADDVAGRNALAAPH